MSRLYGEGGRLQQIPMDEYLPQQGRSKRKEYHSKGNGSGLSLGVGLAIASVFATAVPTPDSTSQELAGFSDLSQGEQIPSLNENDLPISTDAPFSHTYNLSDMGYPVGEHPDSVVAVVEGFEPAYNPEYCKISYVAGGVFEAYQANPNMGANSAGQLQQVGDYDTNTTNGIPLLVVDTDLNKLTSNQNIKDYVIVTRLVEVGDRPEKEILNTCIVDSSGVSGEVANLQSITLPKGVRGGGSLRAEAVYSSANSDGAVQAQGVTETVSLFSQASQSEQASVAVEAYENTEPSPWMPTTVRQWWPQIQEAAAREGVDPQLVAILVLVESGGDPNAGSPAGARGLMQLMPATAAEVAGKLGLQGFKIEQITNPELNLALGTRYLAEQMARFRNHSSVTVDENGLRVADWSPTISLAAAAYNGGPGSAMAYVSGERALPAETRAYVRWVDGMWRERGASDSQTYMTWMAAGGRRLVNAAEVKMNTSQ